MTVDESRQDNRRLKKDPLCGFLNRDSVADHERARYDIKKIVGKGAFGIVCAAYDNIDKCVVAIKRIPLRANELSRLYRELTIHRVLTFANVRRNIDIDIDTGGFVNMKRFIQPPTNCVNRMHVYIVMEYFPRSLDGVDSKCMSLEVHRKFMFMLLCAVRVMHSCGILHRDLKPANMLVDDSGRLVVCDFGLARLQDNATVKLQMSDYVATRYYRAPEVIGKVYGGYTSAMDIWSVGCIFAEKLIGSPLFRGKSSKNQLEVIVNVIGQPTFSEIEALSEKSMRDVLHGMKSSKSSSNIGNLVGLDEMDPEKKAAVDLLKMLLTFDPAKRITAEDALNHEYFKMYSGLIPDQDHLEAISAATCPILETIAKEDLDSMSINDLDERIFKEITADKT
jgi:mitogen-activated protein kinase 1/3